MKRVILIASLTLSITLASIIIADFTHPQRMTYSRTLTKQQIPYKWDKELEERLRELAANSGPWDTAPTLTVVQSIVPWFNNTTYQCTISTFDGKYSWNAYGRTSEEALLKAIEKYLKKEQ